MLSKRPRPESTCQRVDHTLPTAVPSLCANLSDLLNQRNERSIVIICIGTDRSTGDALGPIVGSRLRSLLNPPNLPVYGTLENPVHAINLTDTIQSINHTFANPFIVAVDACLGQLSSVGTILTGAGPLKPGAGVNKNLPEVGDLHITGIVNVGGFMEYFVLQNTRLSLVMNMAECIAQSICKAVKPILDTAAYREVRLESNYL